MYQKMTLVARIPPGRFLARKALLLALVLPCAPSPCLRALGADQDVVTAVSSQASSDYVRTRKPDGSFQPETYTFGEGGFMAGAARDDSIDKLSFLDLARMLSVPLAAQGYVPEADRDPNKTKLLILVYWGKTNGAESASNTVAYQNLQSTQVGSQPPAIPAPSGNSHVAASATSMASVVQAAGQEAYTGALAAAAAENNMRNQVDSRNAAILGYDSELAATTGLEMTAMRNRRQDVVAEIEESRYLVVLMAYDFQDLWKHKLHKLLWVTRLSVRERGTDFTKMLPSMVNYGSQYFGMDSHGLVRKALPQGHVEVGAIKSLGEVPEK
jgi:hypothetical protein